MAHALTPMREEVASYAMMADVGMEDMDMLEDTAMVKDTGIWWTSSG